MFKNPLLRNCEENELLVLQPGFDLLRQQWSLLNRLRTEQGHCGACRRKWRLTDTDLCPCGETQMMPHIVDSCPDKTEWRLISATLWGWRRCFVADQLWLIKRIREEKEKVFTCHQYSVLFFATHWKFKTSNAIDLRPQLIKLNQKID